MDKVLLEFPVLWRGWECDDTAWIMEREDGSRYLKMTNTGKEYMAEVKELYDKLDDYMDVTEKTAQAIKLLEELPEYMSK